MGQLEKYLEAKAERYQTLAQEGNSDLELHAKKFKNESPKIFGFPTFIPETGKR